MNDREYKIVIELPKDEPKKKAVANDTKENPKAEETVTPSGAEKALKSLVSFATVRALSNQLISYELSQVNLRTGANEYEQQLQFGYGLVNKGFNIGMATAAGAMAGGAVGAAVGFVSSTMYSLISFTQNAKTIQTKENLENISIEMQNIRAGVSGRRGNRQ